MPRRLVLALAATMVLYRGGVIELADDKANLAWFAQAWAKVDANEWSLAQLASGWLANRALWGRDLNEAPGLTYALTVALGQVVRQGVRELLA
jgi:tagaturonate reductase